MPEKEIPIIFERKGECLSLSLYLLCSKNKKKVLPTNIETSRLGTTYILATGKTYELVSHFNDRIQSGVFSVNEENIEVDEFHPPAIYPTLLKEGK